MIPSRLVPCLCLALPVSLASCHLVDQRDFNAHAGEKPVPHVAAAPPARSIPALVTISYETPHPDYQAALTDAVHRALAIKPDVLFTVTTLVPKAPDTDAQADAAAAQAAAGRDVAQTIVEAGAQPGQVEQLVSVDPAESVAKVVVRVQ